MISSRRVLLVMVWLAVAAAIGSAEELSAREQLDSVCEWAVFRTDEDVRESAFRVVLVVFSDTRDTEMLEKARDACKNEAQSMRDRVKRYKSAVIRKLLEKFAVRWDEVSDDCDKRLTASRESEAAVSQRDQVLFMSDIAAVALDDTDERGAVAEIAQRLKARVESGKADDGIKAAEELLRVCEWTVFENELLVRVEAPAYESKERARDSFKVRRIASASITNNFYGFEETAAFYAVLKLALVQVSADLTKLLLVLEEMTKGHTGPEVMASAHAYRTALQKANRAAKSGAKLIAAKGGDPVRMQGHKMQLVQAFATVEDLIFDVHQQREQVGSVASRVLLANQRK